ncbi:MAG: hypothetical protein JKX98_01315 [Alcanivoracaceae bacterium]|nr:hypothetical protein [Alcanivoracaceae bacterium]
MDKKQVNAFTISDNRLNIAIDVNNHTKSTDSRYRIIAEVWARNLSKNGSMKPVSWISTMSTTTNGQLNIELDARWIAMAQVDGDFELRNLRIEDADYFIPLITRSSINLKVASLPETANKAYNGAITEEMMMGKRPPQANMNKYGYPGLMLVHGYCSSDVWGPVWGQFAASAIFTDFNQNRSHDQFAYLIGLAGTFFSSYGIVAHSQGGAASLHLYTYYFTGLDYAYGARLIQTVGTPYQGTPLAGTLAAIGNIFGIGCGTNASLTPSGSAAWLAGVPTWARSQIYYHTTSFNDAPFVFDFCSIGTDLFLSDPDDGVVEKFRAQLSGGNNLGHKTGWCHSSSMRDPAQTTDSSRNAVMNIYAKR